MKEITEMEDLFNKVWVKDEVVATDSSFKKVLMIVSARKHFLILKE